MAIVNLTLSVDSAHVPRIRAAIGQRVFNRGGLLAFPDGPQPATVEEVRQEIMLELKNWVLEYERSIAAEAAKAAVQEVPFS